MVNHFASLLINLNLVTKDFTREGYLLASDADEFMLEDSEDEYILSLDDFYTVTTYAKKISPLVNRDYGRLTLPKELEDVYNILFPQASSRIYKEFLLYSYLRIVSSTDRAEDMTIYDTRITYNLDQLDTFFKSQRIFKVFSSAGNYKLSLTGEAVMSPTMQADSFNYIIKQIHNTSAVVVFDVPALKYRKTGKAPNRSPEGMTIPLIIRPGENNTQPVNIEGTDLFFTITGQFECSGENCGFAALSDKEWSFKAEAPFVFPFEQLINELQIKQELIGNMFLWNKKNCTQTYQDMWNMHYNSVYRFTGLLLAYVERMNILWQQNLM